MVDPPDLAQHSHGTLPATQSAPSLNSSLSHSSARRITQQKPRQAARNSHLLASILASLFLCFLLLATSVRSHVLPHSTKDIHVASRAIREPRASSSLADTKLGLEDRAAVEWYAPRQVDSSYLSSLEKNDALLAASSLVKRQAAASSAPQNENTCACNKEGIPTGRKIGFGFLVPILVILSGIFAGLTLGYMSLDETQLQVLMTTGTDVQKERAKKILPIRKDGHLLLTTLLIANMITNETLPIIFDPLLSSSGAGGAVSVVVSTVLIVIFSELIPQSTCSRYGLQIGAVMAMPTRVIIFVLYPVAWPVSRILHFVLGPHHGIVYRRAELKELVTMHAASGGRGGDLKGDTVMIVGGALDLQEKVVKQAMTPINQVFMLPFSAKLDYPTLEKIVRSGHSRIPIYQEVEVSTRKSKSGSVTPKRKMGLLTGLSRKNTSDEKDTGSPGPKGDASQESDNVEKVVRKKILGTLLVKSCVLLDPEDAVPVSSMVINALPTVPWDEPLLNVLNAFQEGRSHMATISSRSRRGLASESIADLGSKSNLHRNTLAATAAPRVDGLGNIDEEKQIDHSDTDRTRSRASSCDSTTQASRESPASKHKHSWRARFGLGHDEEKEQSVPSDATIAESKALEKASDPHELKKIDSRISIPQESEEGESLPLGIITLEDVLEELLGEEILDEYDDRGNEEQDFRNLIPPPSPDHEMKVDMANKDNKEIADEEASADDAQKKLTDEATIQSQHSDVGTGVGGIPQAAKKSVLKRFGLMPRQKTSGDAEGTASVGVDTGVRSQDAATNTSADGVMQRTNKPEHINLPASRAFEEDQAGVRQPQRSSSMPPTNEGQSAGVTDDRQGWLQHFGDTIASPPSVQTPSANRPIVLRTKNADGAEKTVLANESMLRGRAGAPAAPGVSSIGPNSSTGSAAAAPTGLASNQQQAPGNRSQTPAGGNRGLRFKSQAVSGNDISSSTGSLYAPRPVTSQRSRSQGGDAPASRLLSDPTRGDENASTQHPAASSAGPTRTSSPEPVRSGAEEGGNGSSEDVNFQE